MDQYEPLINMRLPPCGLYKTIAPIGSIPAKKLVFFHNHGNPGPGLYLPKGWKNNRVQLTEKGTLLPGPEDVKYLEPLAPEGFYRVVDPFYCCEKKCTLFEAETLVQLGYNASAEPILFRPEFVDDTLAVPQRGTRINGERMSKLKMLKVPISDRDNSPSH